MPFYPDIPPTSLPPLTDEEQRELECQIARALEEQERLNAQLREDCRVRNADQPCTI